MSRLIFTADIDWACEEAIARALDWFDVRRVPLTVFSTHDSPCLRGAMPVVDVGLHPYFASESSQGATTADVVRFVTALPHNVAAYRCHRFQRSNETERAMSSAGMLVSSNVCGDCDAPAPHRTRFGLLELPAAVEDGGVLELGRPLSVVGALHDLLRSDRDVVVIVHPMHLAVNTPDFAYMRGIKDSLTRDAWREMSAAELEGWRWAGHGVAGLLQEIVELGLPMLTMRDLALEHGVDVRRRPPLIAAPSLPAAQP